MLDLDQFGFHSHEASLQSVIQDLFVEVLRLLVVQVIQLIGLTLLESLYEGV